MDTTTALKPPDSLLEAVRYFADEDRALAFMVGIRWPDGDVTCPTCDSKAVIFLKTRRLWKCGNDHAHRQFSVKVGTIMEDSPIKLTKWLPAMWLIVNCKNGISSYELARDLKVSQKCAWFMLHRIRMAMKEGGSFEKLSGPVEADETFIGGKARNMHAHKRAEKIKGTGGVGKALVMGLLDRETGTVRVKHVSNRKRHTLQTQIREHVAPGSEVFTDELASYTGLSEEFVHQFVNHAETYVEGKVHTNGMENFWSLLKRALKGTYVSVEPFHLFRYLDEEVFRFNNRTNTDGERFIEAVRNIVGRRLTFKHLIGADMADSLSPATA